MIFQSKKPIFFQRKADLEISIPDLEISKRAFRKKTPNLRKIHSNFRQFFAKNFTKIPK
jgi:hypothetical protein